MDNKTKTEKIVKEWLSAGIGCAVADMIFNPLEVLKVRRQVLIQTASAVGISENHAQSSSSIEIARRAVREADGNLFRALWQPGLLATWMRGLSYTGFRIGLYGTVRERYESLYRDLFERGSDRGQDQLMIKLLAGATTGAIGSAVFNPIDIVRIRMQSQAYLEPRYPTTVSAFRTIARDEGVVRGLWRGVGVCMARASLLSGSQLGTYDFAKRYLLVVPREDDEDKTTTKKKKKFMFFTEDGPILHFTCAFISGVVAQTVTQPVDTLKTLAMSMNSSNSKGLGAIQLASKVIRERGFLALYRGFWPAAARQGPVMVVQMPIVEQLRKLCGLDYF